MMLRAGEEGGGVLGGGAGSLKWEVYFTVWDDEGCCELVKKVEVSLEEGVSSL
jgi:hypothetical protein